MITGLLMRNYKNYSNVRFIPVCDNTEYNYSVYVGNNGVGKSAVLEAIDVALNYKNWNTTIGTKKTEAFICPVFLINKKMSKLGFDKEILEIVSDYFWNMDDNTNPNIKQTEGLQDLVSYKDELRGKYSDSHYLILIGNEYNDVKPANCASFHNAVIEAIVDKAGKNKDDAVDCLNSLKEWIWNQYSYIYLPVENAPSELLSLQNTSMEKLLNKNLLDEIESILNKKNNSARKSILGEINDNLSGFLTDINTEIAKIDEDYCFKGESWTKQNLTARDIREKIVEAYFPLRALKVGKRRIDQLSSGEQRKAVIDVACSIIMANGEKTTEKNIVLAIDEPESSMHISNCFNQFIMLESLAKDYSKQVIITTHWYGFLPITQDGNMHHIVLEEDRPSIDSFRLFDLLESRRKFPDVVELKSMFDLATSLITFMRSHEKVVWIICEGSDDKIYLTSMLSQYDNIRILSVGGCGNVEKLFHLMYTPMTERTEKRAITTKALFLIDTDLHQQIMEEPKALSSSKNEIICLRRLQIEEEKVKLFKPYISNTYMQTEIEDCLNPKYYFEALSECIDKAENTSLKNVIKDYKLVKSAKISMIRGDNSCIEATSTNSMRKKNKIIEFAEASNNKYNIAKEYSKLCDKTPVNHELAKEIIDVLGLR